MIAVGHIWLSAVALFSWSTLVASHGYLEQPAQRSSAWRFGFNNPKNYNDMELFCGGFGVQWNSENDGRCGACGDPYNAAVKPNEDVDGIYVINGVITGNYVRGGVIETKVRLTAYHMGWFEFRLCPLDEVTTKVTQECLNRTLLHVVGSGITRINLEQYAETTGPGIYEIDLQLPESVTCERCVLQWRYNTGNSWGYEHGKDCMGCGKQETFVNCADIKITDDSTGSSSTTGSSSSASQSATMSALTSSTTQRTSSHSSSTSASTQSAMSSLSTTTTSPPPTTTTTTTTTSTKLTSPSDVHSSSTKQVGTTTKSDNSFVQCEGTSLSCKGVAPYDVIPGLSKWCCNNCRRGYCPDTHCYCLK